MGATPIPAPDGATPARRRQVGDLIDKIKEAADKLEKDGSTRGDLKLLSRSIRELRYALKVFAPYRRDLKVTVFGSARTPPDAPAYQLAVQFGRAMAEHGWLVVTGAASGIMEAGHRGAGREHSMGLNIMLPFEQEANPIIEGDHKLVHMNYFFTRKVMFVKECHAVVCLPGGFGTLDEAMEVLTLLQTGKRDLVPLVFLDEPGGTYWPRFHQFILDELLAKQMISPEDLSLYCLTSDCQAAVREVLDFYRVYHSMRHVRNRLVFRLRQPLAADELAQVNDQFSDMLLDGRFESTPPLPGEADEPELAALPRIAFHFNRRSLGRLRDLINWLNRRPALHAP